MVARSLWKWGRTEVIIGEVESTFKRMDEGLLCQR